MKERVKVLFLDIDGVLNSRAWAEKRGPEGFRIFDPEAVAQLRRIVQQTGCQIVVSSSWRVGRSFTGMREEFGECGMDPEIVGRIIDKTPEWRTAHGGGIVAGFACRGDEIAAWLKGYRRPVEAFVILDDNSDMGALTERLIQTEWAVGLTAADADRAIAMFAEVPA